MPLYPLFADLHGREVLVVGGGEVATRKVEALLDAGARVCVCAPELGDALGRWSRQGRLEHRPEAFDPAWLDGVWLVVAATDDPAFNAWLAEEAGRRRRLANIVDDALLSTFQIPAIVDRAPLLVAISSAGAAPMLARRLRETLETQLDASWGRLAAMLARHRDAIRQRFPDLARRRSWYDAVIDGPVPALMRAGEDAAAEQALLAALDAHVATGGVAVVLTDGDPEQLSLRALRVMNQADLLLHPQDIASELLALGRRDASRLAYDGCERALIARVVAEADIERRVVVLLLRHGGGVDADDIAHALANGLSSRGTPLELVICEGSARLLR